MQIVIDGLADFQHKQLAIGLARPSPAADVSSALAFSLPATEIVGTTVSVAVTSTFRCFAASGRFADFKTVTPGAWSQPPTPYSAIAATGVAFIFDGINITASTSAAIPNTLSMHNASSNDTLTMGLAETFPAGSSEGVEAPTLLKAVDVKTTWLLESPSSCAYLFAISSDVPVGEIIPPQLYLPSPPTANDDGDGGSFDISVGLLVDLSDQALSVTYDSATNSFSETASSRLTGSIARWRSKFC